MAYPYYGPAPFQNAPYNPGFGATPPMADQLTQLRQNGQYQPPNMMGQPPMMNNQPQQPMQMPQQGNMGPMGAQQMGPMKLYDFVQGEAGAKGYLVAANNTMLLLDSEAQTFYLKSTDASGVPMPLRIFDYTERPATNAKPTIPVTNNPADEFVTRKEFDQFRGEIMAEKHQDVAIVAPKATAPAKKTGKEKEVTDNG